MLARKWACEADEQFKLRKTDECVEICRKQANRYKNENPCKWREYAICGGFLILYVGFSFLDTVTIYRYNQ